MGCDIHCVLQKQDEITKEWNTIMRDVFPGRQYTFFAWLRGVRGGNGQHISNEGLPKDFSLENEEDDDFDLGDHSYGHVLLSKFMKARIPEAYSEELQPYKDAIMLFIGDYGLYQYRLVFGFDS